ncbi:hypothetical protein E2C01_042517 [Portunus trituberculatus]|uniref:Uncharacterized protein n=1 Tax=Portunus trituberculatus TaxID=210409 RepID=A0A5B7FUV9_PORTR|nr:hypothetical protein [Portunus trituberculatus]
MTPIAPRWHQADSFSLLLSLLVDYPRVLPPWASLYCQPHRHLFHKSPGALHLCGDTSISSEREAFHGRLLDLWPIQSHSPLSESITGKVHLLATLTNCMGYQQKFITLRVGLL